MTFSRVSSAIWKNRRGIVGQRATAYVGVSGNSPAEGGAAKFHAGFVGEPKRILDVARRPHMALVAVSVDVMVGVLERVRRRASDPRGAAVSGDRELFRT